MLIGDGDGDDDDDDDGDDDNDGDDEVIYDYYLFTLSFLVLGRFDVVSTPRQLSQQP